MSINADNLYDILYTSVKHIESYQAFSNILNKRTLEDYHTADLLKALFNKRYICAYEQGLQRSLVGYAFMRALKNYDSNFKFIMIVKNGDIEAIAKDLQSYCKFKVTYSTAETKVIDKKLVAKDFITSDVLLLTHECLNNIAVMNIVYHVRSYFKGLIIDNANELSNIQGSQSAFSLLTIAKNFLYVLGLCDSSIVKNPPLLTNLFYIINRRSVGNFRQTEDIIRLDGYEIFTNILSVRTKHKPGVMSSYL